MKILREPLVHFLLLGAGLFLLAGLLKDGTGHRAEAIVVTQGQINALAVGFARTWQRLPSQQELDGLIRDYVREEVYYREGISLGLDRDDIIIRRRMRQKMEFLSEDVAATAEPTDTDLAIYLRNHPSAFQLDGRLSFDQVFLNPGRRGDRLTQDASELLERLRQLGPAADGSTLGDGLLLEPSYAEALTSDIARDFGEAFADTLIRLPLGQWVGPIESGYGVHLVLVRKRIEGRVPPLQEVREAVRREWLNARRLEASEQYYQGLLQKYRVVIEPPASGEPRREVGGGQR